MMCPKCDGDLDAYLKVKWGDGVQKQKVAPFVCAWCASLMLIDLETKTLITDADFQITTGMSLRDCFRHNKPLWQAIEENQKLILSAPGRRPVLR